MTTFEIECLDHVAIRVKDMQDSAQWYKEVLGLKKCEVKEWGTYPVFLLSGTTGIALFPAHLDDFQLSQDSRNVKIDHFAFRVSNENFKKALTRYGELNIEYNLQDHHHFHSVYVRDPDGHVVELTTLLTDPQQFYP